MANENFMRTYTMKCGKMGKTGFQIGNINSPIETVLHVSFSIEKSDSETANTAKVQVWNLSPNNLKILDTEDCVVELKAGYGNINALILVGNIVSVITTPDAADRMTEIEIVDGRVALRDTNMSVSFNGSVNCKDVYNRIANDMGLSIVFAKDLSYKKLSNGFSFVGKGRNALQKVANACGHSWTIQNEVIQITCPGRAINTNGHLLNSDTGLISVPKRITIGSNASGKEVMTGLEIQYLLNGAIGVNEIVKLESSTASGYYRIYKVTFDGDNMEGDWMCTAQVLEIKAQPKLDKKAGTSIATSNGSNDIKKGDKVKVIRTFQEAGKAKSYQYGRGTFVLWHSVYDVIQVKGDRVVIGIGSIITAAVNVKDIAKA